MFAKYVAMYGKSYANDEEWAHRKQIYSDNHNYIQTINSSCKLHKADHNMFSDWTQDEYKKILGTWDRSKLAAKGSLQRQLKAPKMLDTSNLPSEVNWFAKGGVTPVKN